MNFSLIVPVAADKKEYEDNLPYVFNTINDGIMICVHSIMGLNLDIFDKIYFTILKKHDDKFYLQELLDVQFRRIGIKKKVEVIVLEEVTSSQAATIYETIKRANITGGVMIKDGDSYFEAKISLKNSICIFPLDELDKVNPQGKSYVAIDDGYYVTNMIEHRIISRYFSVGGYIFESAQSFLRFYLSLKEKETLYLSHIIYAMLLAKYIFRPVECKNYKDWGTFADYYNCTLYHS